MNNHDFFMQEAIKMALQGKDKGEVPIGAVLVYDNEIIASDYNRVIELNDPTAHAEILVLRKAGKVLNNYRLLNTVLYVTLEPCLMCYSAMINARIKRLVYSANDKNKGIFSVGLYNKVEKVYNHKIEVVRGILDKISSDILLNFFKQRRDAGVVERGGLENRYPS